MEAKEEAGILGKVSLEPIGTYSYWKELARVSIQIKVSVFTLAVAEQLFERRAKWMNAAEFSFSDRGLIRFINKIGKIGMEG